MYYSSVLDSFCTLQAEQCLWKVSCVRTNPSLATLQVGRHRNSCVLGLWDKADPVWLSFFSMSMGQAVQFLSDFRGKNSSVRVLYPQIQTVWQHIPWGIFALANWQCGHFICLVFQDMLTWGNFRLCAKFTFSLMAFLGLSQVGFNHTENQNKTIKLLLP